MNCLDQQFGNYQLTRLLGHGGFADVYLGEHVYLKSLAAIKILRTSLIKDEREAFLTEARMLISLTHPHIIRLLDFGVEGSQPFLVMDYAPNGTLRQRHHKGEHVPLSTVISYVAQVAEALRSAHQQKLVHRDVKPENMLIGKHDDILLSDFGIAVVAQSSRYQGPQDIAGTITYMAPEQIQAHSCPASDQYALGMIVYEWLSGDTPFHGSFTEIAAKHAFVAPPPLCEKNPSVAPSVEQVVMKALEKEPTQRFPNISTFALALEQASQETRPAPFNSPLTLSGESFRSTLIPTYQSPHAGIGRSSLEQTLLATPANAPSSNTDLTHVVGQSISMPDHGLLSAKMRAAPNTPAKKRRGISRRALIGGTIGIVVAGAGGGFASHMIAGRPNPTSAVTAPSVGATSTSSPTNTSSMLVYHGPSKMYTASWSPDGRYIASAGEGATIQVWDATTSNILFSLDTASIRVYRVAWSPDGTRIVSGQEDGSVQIWDIKTKLMHRLTGHTRKVNCVAWSPDSTRVVSGSSDKTAMVWDAATGAPLFSYGGHTSWIDGVAWSHNGTSIVSGGGDSTAQVWSATDGALLCSYTNHTGEVLALAWSPDSTHIASASVDETAQVWDAATGHLAMNYIHHNGFVVAVDWSLDGVYIASGGVDTTVQIWHPYSGIPLQIYRGHTDEIEGIAWAPDSRHIASASDDMTVRTWQILLRQ